MNVSICWLRRQIAACLVLFLVVPFGKAATALQIQQEAASSPQTESQDTNSQVAKPNTTPQTQEPSPAPSPLQNAPEPQQNQDHQPVGVAVAPYEKGMGLAASRPSGAAIAPAKQKRVRTIWISVGVLVATGVAVGTVVGLSKGSPSQPH
jgi:hypothetical protein